MYISMGASNNEHLSLRGSRNACKEKKDDVYICLNKGKKFNILYIHAKKVVITFIRQEEKVVTINKKRRLSS